MGNNDSTISGLADQANNLLEARESEFESLIAGCTECGNCVEQCTYLQRFGTPLSLARQFQSGSLPVETVFSCSLCKLCDVFCPESLQPSYLFWLMRCMMVERGLAPLKQHRRILAYEKQGLTRLFSHRALPAACSTVFFPGCALTGSRPRQVLDLFFLLRTEIPMLGMVLGCCAKPSHDLGRFSFFEKSFSDLVNSLKGSGITTVLSACPSCHQMFRQYADDIELKSIYEVIDTTLEPAAKDSRATLTIHDPCATRFDNKIHQAVRSMAAKLGFSLVEMKHRQKKTYCCGEGGATCYIAADITDSWSEKRLDEASDRHLLTYCAGCVHFLGRKSAATHIIDLLLNPELALAGKEKISKSPFTWINRLLLKNKLKSLVTPP